MLHGKLMSHRVCGLAGHTAVVAAFLVFILTGNYFQSMDCLGYSEPDLCFGDSQIDNGYD